MKRWISLALAALLTLGAAGCGAAPAPESIPVQTAAPTEAPTAAPTEAPRPNELRIGVAEAPSGLLAGPLIPGNDTDRSIWNLINDHTTFVINQLGAAVENLAVLRSWSAEKQSDGSVIYTLNLREDLTYSDNSPITAGDFVLPMLCGAITGREALGYRVFTGAEDYATAAAESFAGIRIPDDHTLQLRVDATYAQYFYAKNYLNLQPWNPEFWLGKGWSVGDDGTGACLMSGSRAFRMEPQQLEKQLRTAAADWQHMPTAGPYILKELGQTKAVLEKNRSYGGNFENYQPSIQTLQLIAVTGDPLKALESGEVDLLPRLTDPEIQKQAAETYPEGGDFEALSFARAGYGMIRFNCAATPTKSAAVRQAIASLLDRPALWQALGGTGEPVSGPYSAVMWQTHAGEEFLPGLNPYVYDEKTAAGYLDAGGWNLDERGGDWSGSGLRCKEVSESEKTDDCITLSDGRILMPLKISCVLPETAAGDQLTLQLQQDAFSRAGMEISVTAMPFSQLAEAFPEASLTLLAEEYPSSDYDHSFRYTADPALLEAGWNPTGLQSEALDVLSTAMVYSVAPGDWQSYLSLWEEYVQLSNDLLPELPVFPLNAVTVAPRWLEQYEENAYWDFSRSVLYASIRNAK